MPHCSQCSHCEDDPGAFERMVPGLGSLSSGYGESKGETALCRRHNMFMIPGPGCTEFEARLAAARTEAAP
ncbi:MAG TPA: hypothetical protein VF816_10775 [Rhodocyclaceae bacterium]